MIQKILIWLGFIKPTISETTEINEYSIDIFKEKISILKSKVNFISNGILKKKLRKIIGILTDILTYIEQEHQSLEHSKNIFTETLNSLFSVINKYIKLSNSENNVNKLIDFYEQVEPSFDDCILFLEKYFENIKQSDKETLNLELKFLKSMNQ